VNDGPLPVCDIDTGGNHVGAVLYPVGNLSGHDDDEVICLYRAGGTSSPHAPDGRVVQRRSTDRGRTWGERRTVFDSPYSDVTGDGGVTPGGSLLCFLDQRDHDEDGIDRTVATGFIRSEDGGRTWSAFTALDARDWPRYSSYGALCTVDGPDGPELLKPIWGGTEVDHPEGLHHRGESWVVASGDDGHTWEYRGTVEESGPDDEFRNETSVTALPDGTLLAVVRWQGVGFEQYHSTDRGATWTLDGVTTIGNAGADVSPFVYTDGDAVRFVGAHRTPYHDERNVQWLSYASAPADTVVGAPDAWVDHLWFVQATADQNLMGYPEVTRLGEETLVAFSWRDRDAAINLSVTTADAIRRLCAGNEHVRYDATVDARGVRTNGPLYLSNHHPLVSVDAGSGAAWTAASVARVVPTGARRALLWVDLRPVDGSARLELRNPERVDFEAYAESHSLVDAESGPRGRRDSPGFAAGVAADGHVAETVACPLGDGRFKWRVAGEAACDIALVGFA
jgi:hypothetical protein